MLRPGCGAQPLGGIFISYFSVYFRSFSPSFAPRHERRAAPGAQRPLTAPRGAAPTDGRSAAAGRRDGERKPPLCSAPHRSGIVPPAHRTAPRRPQPPAATPRPAARRPPTHDPRPPHAQRPPPFFPYRAQRAEGRLAEERGLRLRRPRRIEEAAGGEWEGAEGAGLLQGARAAPPGAALHGPAALGLRLRLTARSAAARPLLAAAETPPLTGPPRRRVPLAGKASAALTSTRRHGRGMWKTQHRDPPPFRTHKPLRRARADGSERRGRGRLGRRPPLVDVSRRRGGSLAGALGGGGGRFRGGACGCSAGRGGAGLGLCLAERRQGRWASSCTVLGPGRAPQQLSVKRRFPWLSEGRVS